ncbi:serine/threonine protein kinase [Mycobacterium sp. M1]|uniref:non-specific serine/threonine protein kinase n=1 Tax=Mycolicibacter acidiphilus TaxID=2835306 RepID=A0ABS5RMG6_9MYCO|nr:serine/threonine-protein kinase [Mycolicibacter acidiphilus]MBS9535498.1 serine/threonine protein kinase [Mycolicibacter acidiphilus]
MPLPAGASFAGFSIVRLLGTGGMSEVYLAKHPRLNRYDAVKILPAQFSADTGYRRRFEREADLAASLSHAHIVSVHDRGEFEGQLWISMDYVDGTDAAALRRDHYPNGMPRTEVSTIITAIGSALDFAHGRGLLHRDVKPANILLADPGTDHARILLADFGIARAIHDTAELTATNTTLGTLNYTAPEQLLGNEIDGRADQYALAASAYYLLTGAPPFTGATAAVVINAHLSAPVPLLSAARPDLADLDAVFARALAKSPNQRFPSCRDFADALRTGAHQPIFPAPPVLVSPPPVPPPVPPHYPVIPQPPARPARNVNGALLAALAAAVVLLVAALVWVGINRGGSQGTRATPTATPAPSPTAQPVPPTSTSAPGRPSYRSAGPSAPSMSAGTLPDADQWGFLAGGARCATGDYAQLLVRTEDSTAVICARSAQSFYYRGARNSDGAAIELTDVHRTATGYTAINEDGPTQYLLSRSGLQIVQGGRVISDEPAVESGP